MTSACAIERLAAPRGRSVLVVAAHPDDEVIGVGATIASLARGGARVRVLIATDGAPRDPGLRPTLRDRPREDAAAVRRAESARALSEAGLDPDAVLAYLGAIDQEAALELAPLARAVAEHLSGVDVVVTHPYEGGHPDHDAVAFAVHAARALVDAPPALAEMTSYHAEHGALVTARFLPCPPGACPARHEGPLDDAARATRRRMLDAFESQREVLASFRDDVEPLRCAPAYDFARPPHEGRLWYEQLPFGWSSARFCELARDALRALAI